VLPVRVKAPTVPSEWNFGIDPEFTKISCCPDSKGDLIPLNQAAVPSGRIKLCVFFCRAYGAVVGIVRNFQFDFLDFDKEIARQKTKWSNDHAPRLLERNVTRDIVPYNDSLLFLKDSWEDGEGPCRMSYGSPTREVSFNGKSPDISAGPFLNTYLSGELSRTIGRTCKAAGFPRRIDETEHKKLMERIKFLDQFVPEDAFCNIASDVALCGSKKQEN